MTQTATLTNRRKSSVTGDLGQFRTGQASLHSSSYRGPRGIGRVVAITRHSGNTTNMVGGERNLPADYTTCIRGCVEARTPTGRFTSSRHSSVLNQVLGTLLESPHSQCGRLCIFPTAHGCTGQILVRGHKASSIVVWCLQFLPKHRVPVCICCQRR